jgi:hypothetical protein
VISYVETGRRELGPLELLAFAQQLDVPAASLLLFDKDDELPLLFQKLDAETVRQVVLGGDATYLIDPPAPLADDTGSDDLEALADQLRSVWKEGDTQ